jgi:polysaccharide export outer membrane protein
MTGMLNIFSHFRMLAVVNGIALLTAGCAPKYADLKTFVQGHEKQVAAVEYRLEPPDVIAIASPTAPEVDGDVQQIRSDGKISLKLIGEMQAAHLTPRELASKIEEALSRYYHSPSVSVRVMSFESKKIYVFGQVGRSGALPFTGRDTVLDVLAETQLTPAAWGAMVKVIRPSASPDERHEIVVNVVEMMQSGDLRANFLLQEGDIVFVPPTPFAWAGAVIQEVMFPVTAAANAYSTPASFIAATEYYRNRDSGRSYIRLSPGSLPGGIPGIGY